MIETSQQQFIDSVFGIRDLADPSKLGQFDASAISAGFARVLAFPNASGTIALEGWVDDNFLSLDGEGSDVINGTFNLTTTGTIQGGSITDGVATLTGGNLTNLGGLTLTGFSGILKAVIGVVTSDAIHGDLADADWATVSDHDLRYFTKAELGSNDNALGASLIGIEDSMALYEGTDVEAALQEVMDDITIVTHVADSVTMDVGSATGSVSDTWGINDENIYNIHETTGSPNPNFVATFDFSGITAGHEPNLIEIHWGYNGGSGHIIELQMYNYNTSTWDVINNTILTDNDGDFLFDSFNITDGGGTIVDYTSGGAARVRFSHAANGNAAHDFLIDYLAIKDDHGIGSGITDHGSMSGLGDDDHLQYHNDARAATWLATNHETTYGHAAIALNTTHRGVSSGNPHVVTPTELSLVIGFDVLAYDAGLSNLASIAMSADKFYYTSADNVHVVATVTSFARSILDDANEATFKATVNLEIGTDVLAQQTIGIANNNLLEVDHVSPADNDYAKFTAAGLEGRSYSEVRTDLDLVIGSDVQAYDAGLTSLAGLTYAVASFVKMTGADTFALRTIGETADDLESTIVHDNLASIPANDHIDHTGVTLTAGIGLTGGGDISANLTFDIDIPGLSEDTVPQATVDYVATYDGSASAHKKVLVEDLGPFGSVSRTQTVNLLQSDSATQMQAKIDALGKYIPSGQTITFQFETGGTHTLNTAITFSEFFGAGNIVIQGNISEAGAQTKHTTQDTILDFNNDTIGLNILNTEVYILVKNLKIIIETDVVANTRCIFADIGNRVEAWYCYFVGNNTVRGSGFQARYCRYARCFQCLFSNFKYCMVSTGSRLHAWDNDDTGTQPQYGLWAGQIGYIGKQSTQPSGSVANELIEAGSQII